jgi:hypothetical protein
MRIERSAQEGKDFITGAVIGAMGGICAGLYFGFVWRVFRLLYLMIRPVRIPYRHESGRSGADFVGAGGRDRCAGGDHRPRQGVDAAYMAGQDFACPGGSTALVGNGRMRRIIGHATAGPVTAVKVRDEITKAGRRADWCFAWAG